jgi:hypothetical protein
MKPIGEAISDDEMSPGALDERASSCHQHIIVFLPVPGGWLYQVRVSSTSNSSVALCFVPDAKARHMRELSRQRAAAALTEMEERPLGRSLGKRKSR